MLDIFQSLGTTQIIIMLRESKNWERRMRWITACHPAWTVLMLRVTPEYVQFISEGDLGPTKLNPVSSMFAFPQHLWRKPPKRRTDRKERRRKQWKETPQTSRSKKVFTSRKNKQEVKPELMDRSSKEEYSAFEGASTPYCQPVYVKCRCPNWLNSLRQRGKQVRELLQTNSKVLCDAYKEHRFSALASTFPTRELSFWQNLTEIFLKNSSRDQQKAAQRSTLYFGAKDFTPRKSHFRVKFFARPKVTGNTKLDYFDVLYKTRVYSFQCSS